jgi:hypothetical protein
MGFAADAVLNIVTPPPRDAAPAAEEDASFADHLAAHSESTEPGETADKLSEDKGDGETALAPLQHTPAAAAPAPLIMQLAVNGQLAAPAAEVSASESAATGAPPEQRAPTEIAQPEPPPAQNASPVQRQAKTRAALPEAAPSSTAPPTADAKATDIAPLVQPQPAQTTPTANAAAPAQFNPVVAAAVAAINAVTQQSTAQQRIGRAAAAIKSASSEQAPPSNAVAPQSQAPAKAAPAKLAADRFQAALNAAPSGAPQASAQETAPQGASAHVIATHAPAHVGEAATEAGVARTAPVALQVAREIVRRFDGGSTRFELRLDPPELGRIEVRLDVSRDHRVTAVIAADNPQSLTELARHARELEQQLHSAGLTLSENGLSFDLRQGARGDDSGDGADHTNHAGQERKLDAEAQATLARPIGLERWRGVRVDLMV